MGRLTEYFGEIKKTSRFMIADGHGKAYRIALKLKDSTIKWLNYIGVRGEKLYLLDKNVGNVETIIEAWVENRVATNDILRVIEFKMSPNKFWSKLENDEVIDEA